MSLDHPSLDYRPTNCTYITCDVDPADPEHPADALTMERFFALKDAIAFARRAHSGQRRVSGSAFISHPLAVLQILLAADTELPRETYIAGLLHDTLEDGKTTKAEIRAAFGEEVLSSVVALTRPPKLRHSRCARHEQAYIDQMILANEYYPYVLLIKLADRLHNVETAHFLPQVRSKALIEETSALYLPAFRAQEAKQTRFEEAYKTLLGLLEESVAKHMENNKC